MLVRTKSICICFLVFSRFSLALGFPIKECWDEISIGAVFRFAFGEYIYLNQILGVVMQSRGKFLANEALPPAWSRHLVELSDSGVSRTALAANLWFNDINNE